MRLGWLRERGHVRLVGRQSEPQAAIGGLRRRAERRHRESTRRRGTGDRCTRCPSGHRVGRKVRTPEGSAPGNPRSGRPEGKWHRKHTASRRVDPSAGRGVRVKRCGKSAPRPPQGGWQAKPRTEQDRIGRRSRAARPKPPGRLLDPASDGGARGMVVARRLSVRGRRRVQNSAYRPSAALFSRFRAPASGGAGQTSSVVPRTAWTVTGWPGRISHPAAVASERHSSPRTRT